MGQWLYQRCDHLWDEQLEMPRVLLLVLMLAEMLRNLLVLFGLNYCLLIWKLLGLMRDPVL